MLFGYQPDPSSKLSPIVKAIGVANARHQRAGRDRADARDLLELATDITFSVPDIDLYFEFTDLLVEFLQEVHQSLHQQPEGSGQIVGRIFNQLWYSFENIADPLRDDDPELTKQTANLVGLSGA